MRASKAPGDQTGAEQTSKEEADISIVSDSVSPKTRCSSLTLLEMTNQLQQHKYATAPEEK